MPADEKYQVVLVPEAQEDIRSIVRYIAFELRSPDAALDLEEAFYAEIKKLSYLADSLRPVEEEPWHSAGVRKIQVKNYYVYYYVDRSSLTVSVIAVIYTRRDQVRQIGERGLRFKI